MMTRISIKQAAALGVERLRLPKWANKFDHLKIDIIGDGEVGPWLHLYAPFNKECNGRDPVTFLWVTGPMKTDINTPEFVAYRGPLPDSEEYQKEVARFEGCLGEDRRK